MPPEMPRKPRQDRPFAEQHEEWIAHLRGQVVSRRTVVRGAVGAAAGSLLLGSGRWSSQAVVLRFINEQGRELDRVVFTRVAGGVA